MKFTLFFSYRIRYMNNRFKSFHTMYWITHLQIFTVYCEVFKEHLSIIKKKKLVTNLRKMYLFIMSSVFFINYPRGKI